MHIQTWFESQIERVSSEDPDISTLGLDNLYKGFFSLVVALEKISDHEDLDIEAQNLWSIAQDALEELIEVYN